MSELAMRSLLLCVGFLLAGTAAGATITLQQGVNGYKGCSSRTIIAGSPSTQPAADGTFALRGSKHDLHVRFDLPGGVKAEHLARARLMVFLPAAGKPNLYTEIFCHEVTTAGRKPGIDEVADYANGRRAGAVDSVELFAPQEQPGWKHYPWLPLGVPEGGKWIEFNVTALAEKWLANPAGNHGVMLMPTDPADRQYPGTWEIDIPLEGNKDEAHRPKLVLETAPLEADVLIGFTHSLDRVNDRSTRFAFRGQYGNECKLSMAGNEFEGFQLVVYPMLADLANARLTCGDLTSADGKKIPAADVECFLADSYPLRRNWMTAGIFFGGKLYDSPDPLLPARPMTLKRHVHTAFYFRVRTRPDTAGGTYSGTIKLEADGVAGVSPAPASIKPLEMKLEVKVWPYQIPQRWNFHTMGQFIWENVARFHGKDATPELYQRYYDFLMEHRFAPTEQYSGSIASPRMKLQECLKAGLNTIYLSGNFTGGQAEIDRLKKDYEALKKLGALDYALVYVGDETHDWDEMHRRADLVHAHLPGVQVMIGGSFPRQELLGYIDIYDPQIGGGNKTYSLEQDNANLIGESQKRGEEFYWYVAAGPSYPYPNVQVEYPLVDARALFWMTFKYGVSGFEYYCYNIWERNYRGDPAKRYPASRWEADGWSKGWPSNGDGMLFYPGPVSSLRFEAIRDGIEDWESLTVLRDCVSALQKRKNPSKYKALISSAQAMLKVDPEIVSGFDSFTRDPARLLEQRERLGELIAAMLKQVQTLEKWDAGQMGLAHAAEVRIGAQTALRRKMLLERHVKACEALKVEPLSAQAWAELWPARVLFAQGFETDPPAEVKGQAFRVGAVYDWNGNIVTDNVPAGSKRALAGVKDNKFYGQWIRVGIYWDNARAATTTWLKFRYFLNKPSPVALMVFDMTYGDNYAYTLANPEVGKWAEVQLNVTTDFRKKGGGNLPIKAGNALDDVFFGAGKPGDAELQLLVDDVQLLGRD